MSKLSKTTVSFLFFCHTRAKEIFFPIFFKSQIQISGFLRYLLLILVLVNQKKKKKKKNTNNVKFLDSCQDMLFFCWHPFKMDLLHIFILVYFSCLLVKLLMLPLTFAKNIDF